ncbi:acyl-CoA thioesterase [Paracoccus salsus]|uniref:acyl-CoA thioesterase n=1 Tax=Paracoccus salsus TaxID=2911061 RepID=UPI001F4927D5|nr:acyl-CoA thioesterase [Paracoccus salsus]MCF3972168.1 acyl-CoA thioesterase [Paracoccus salsus]
MNERKPPGTRADYAVFQPMQTRWNDNDQFGHLYNATYTELFDEAMNMTLLERGFLDHRGGGSIQVVVENGCLYFREVAHPDRLEIGLRLTGLGRTSFRLEMGMFRQGDATESARAHFALVNVDHATRRPLPLSDAQRSALQDLGPGLLAEQGGLAPSTTRGDG